MTFLNEFGDNYYFRMLLESLYKLSQIDISAFEPLFFFKAGGTSKIYLIRHKITKKIYIAKIIERNDLYEDYDEMAKSEIINTILNQHQTVVKLYGYSLTDFEGNKNVTMILNYYEKGSLFDYTKLIQRGLADLEFNNTIIFKILISIARTIQKMHNRQIIHGDLKLANILIDKNFDPAVSDFGLSMNKNQKKIQTGGTPNYMAPEVITNGEISEKADVYSFGIIMFELFTGQFAYESFLKNDSDYIKLQRKICDENYRPEFNVQLKKPARNLIERCWSQNPNERPDFDEILDLLINNDVDDNGECKFLDGVEMDLIEIFIEKIFVETDPIELFIDQLNRLKREIQLYHQYSQFNKEENLQIIQLDSPSNYFSFSLSKCSENIYNEIKIYNQSFSLIKQSAKYSSISNNAHHNSIDLSLNNPSKSFLQLPIKNSNNYSVISSKDPSKSIELSLINSPQPNLSPPSPIKKSTNNFIVENDAQNNSVQLPINNSTWSNSSPNITRPKTTKINQYVESITQDIHNKITDYLFSSPQITVDESNGSIKIKNKLAKNIYSYELNTISKKIFIDEIFECFNEKDGIELARKIDQFYLVIMNKLNNILSSETCFTHYFKVIRSLLNFILSEYHEIIFFPIFQIIQKSNLSMTNPKTFFDDYESYLHYFYTFIDDNKEKVQLLCEQNKSLSKEENYLIIEYAFNILGIYLQKSYFQEDGTIDYDDDNEIYLLINIEENFKSQTIGIMDDIKADFGSDEDEIQLDSSNIKSHKLGTSTDYSLIIDFNERKLNFLIKNYQYLIPSSLIINQYSQMNSISIYNDHLFNSIFTVIGHPLVLNNFTLFSYPYTTLLSLPLLSNDFDSTKLSRNFDDFSINKSQKQSTSCIQEEEDEDEKQKLVDGIILDFINNNIDELNEKKIQVRSILKEKLNHYLLNRFETDECSTDVILFLNDFIINEFNQIILLLVYDLVSTDTSISTFFNEYNEFAEKIY